MALPLTRNRTYVKGTPVEPNDLNDIQDALIGGKHGPITRASTWVPQFAVNMGWNGGGGGLFYTDTTGAASSSMSLLVEPGERITAVSVRAYGNGITDMNYKVAKVGTDGAVTQLSGEFGYDDIDRAAAWGEVVLPVTPTVLGVGESIVLIIASTGNQYRIASVQWTVDRL